MRNSNYDTDFYGWAIEQAALLRARELSAADVDNIAEEIESLGRSEKRELISRFTVLLTHLLKWKFQPKGRCSSWRDQCQDAAQQHSRSLAGQSELEAANSGCDGKGNRDRGP